VIGDMLARLELRIFLLIVSASIMSSARTYIVRPLLLFFPVSSTILKCCIKVSGYLVLLGFGVVIDSSSSVAMIWAICDIAIMAIKPMSFPSCSMKSMVGLI